MKGAGYDTAFIGKWHMPGGGLPQLPGVDLFVSFTKKDGQGDYYNCPIYVNHELTPNRKAYITEEVYELFRDFPFGGRVPPHKALRTERYKYIVWECCRDPEIYDLKKDPRERHNLLSTTQGAELAEKLASELDRLKDELGLKASNSQ